MDGVLLCSQIGIQGEEETAVAGFDGLSGSRFKGAHKAAHGLLGGIVQGRVDFHFRPLDTESAVREGDIGRHGNHVESLRLRLGTGGRENGQRQKKGNAFHIKRFNSTKIRKNCQYSKRPRTAPARMM